MSTIIPIPGLESMYAVSDDGRVWSYKTGKWLKHSLSRGYPMVNLTVENPRGRVGGSVRGPNIGRQCRQKVFRVHRLMHRAFFPKAAGVINHKDGNKLNNTLENLEVVTSAENNKHAYRIGLKQPVAFKRESNRSAKLTSNQVWEVVQCVFNGFRPEEVGAAYGIVAGHVTKLFNDHFGFGSSRMRDPLARHKAHLIRLNA